MIPKTEFFEWIENYFHDQLSEKEKKEFETELKHNSDLMEELKLHQEIAQALSEKEIFNLRSKLQKISQKRDSGKNSYGNFDLLEDFTNIEEISENISPEELINFYDSLPKVHVYQHEISSNENVHEFYKEQNKSKHNGELDDSSEDFDFEDFEGLEEAILEEDIFDLRETLSQVAKSVKLQYSTEDIDSYINGELVGDKLIEFEKDLENSSALKEEVELHMEMENALLENDILKLRNQLDQIMKTETSWNVSEENIERYIDGELEVELLDEFLAELEENTDLKAEVNMRCEVNDAIGESEIFKLRVELAKARNSAEDTEVKSIIPESRFNLANLAKKTSRFAAVLILLLGLTGILNMSFDSDQTYKTYNTVPQWSPERSLNLEMEVDHRFLLDGNLYLAEGKYKKAIEKYDMAIKTETEKFAAHYYKGRSLQQLEKFKEALPEYNEVIRHDNNTYIEEAEWNRALCLIKLGEMDRAKLQLTAIVDKNSFYRNDANAILRRLKISFK